MPERKLYVIPDHDCKLCHGEGVVYDTVDYGSTTAQMPEMCDCVAKQIPEEYDGLQLEYTNQSEIDSLKGNWLQVYCPKRKVGLAEGEDFIIEALFHTGVESGGCKEISGKKGPDLRTLEAVLRYVQSQFPEGWKVVNGKVVSGDE